MRIALFNDAVELGGAERYFRDLVAGLGVLGHDVHAVLSAREGARAQIAGLSVTASITRIRAGVRPLSAALGGYLEARHYLLRLRPDVVHFSLHHADSCRYWIEAARRLSVPFFLTEHAVTEKYVRASRLTHWFKTRSYREARAVLFNGETARRLGLASWRGNAPRAVVVPCGVRIDEFSDDADRSGMRVCFVGRLAVQKDPVAAVRAFAHIARDFPGATLHIYGDGPLHKLVSEEASRSKAADRITLHGYTDKIPDALTTADILLLPSRAENLPYALLEAMASGCAVIATSVGDIPTLLADGAGIVVAPGDDPALAAALRRFLADPEAAEQAGQQGRKRVAALYTVDRMISNIVKLYENARSLPAPPGRPPLG